MRWGKRPEPVPVRLSLTREQEVQFLLPKCFTLVAVPPSDEHAHTRTTPVMVGVPEGTVARCTCGREFRADRGCWL